MPDPRTVPRLSGRDLADLRRAVGLSQTDLARRAGLTRYTVSRWERKAVVDVEAPTPRRLLRVLMPPGRAHLGNALARTRGDEVLYKLQQRVLGARWAAQEMAERAQRPVLCGARTHKGQPCRNMSEPGRSRCKFHGGKSTGPRTAEGRARTAEAQRRRWAAWRAARSRGGSTNCKKNYGPLDAMNLGPIGTPSDPRLNRTGRAASNK